jgi:DnaK suppressor protein
MATQLTEEHLENFRRTLEARRAELQQEVREEVQRSDQTHFTDVAGEVHDPEEASVASLVIDVDLANIDRHIQEIRDIEAALIRIGSREYGICIDCEQPIALARLAANPTAERCINCQSALEREAAQFNTAPISHHSL